MYAGIKAMYAGIKAMYAGIKAMYAGIKAMYAGIKAIATAFLGQKAGILTKIAGSGQKQAVFPISRSSKR
jgi:hypothetical protein